MFVGVEFVSIIMQLAEPMDEMQLRGAWQTSLSQLAFSILSRF